MKKTTPETKESEAKPEKPKRRYFIPSAMKSVEADSIAEALEKLNKQREEGDGNR